MTETDQSELLRKLMVAIVTTIRDAGPLGAPAGPMYAAMMAHGCNLEQFERIMGAIVRSGVIVKRGQCYFIAGGR